MKVFHRSGSVVQISLPIAIFNAALLYGFFFIADYMLKLRGNTIRGFFCVDPTIHYTKKASTVTSLQHRIYNITLMIASVFIVEAYRHLTQNPRYLEYVYRMGSTHIPKYLVNILTFIGSIGRLRPYFYAVCNPLPIKECEELNPNSYIENYQCQGNFDEVEEARRSFYSGHSTVTMYCAFWTVLYLQARLKPVLQNNVIVSILQSFITAGGLFICCSRISDNKHHWSDVLAGIVVGMSLATISSVWWGKLFSSAEVGADLHDNKETSKFDDKDNV